MLVGRATDASRRFVDRGKNRLMSSVAEHGRWLKGITSGYRLPIDEVVLVVTVIISVHTEVTSAASRSVMGPFNFSFSRLCLC